MLLVLLAGCSIGGRGGGKPARNLTSELRSLLDPSFEVRLDSTFSASEVNVLLVEPGRSRVFYSDSSGRIRWASTRSAVGMEPGDFELLGSRRETWPVALPRSVDRESPSPAVLIAVESSPSAEALAEAQAIVIHEGFHLSYQRVPATDIEPLLDQIDLPAGLWPDMERGRKTLEGLYRTDPRFRSRVGEELCLLQKARRSLRLGDAATSLELLGRFRAARSRRHTEWTSSMRLYEAYWEYIEGTATYVESIYWKSRHGVDRLEAEEPCAGESLAHDSYFLPAGALLCSILEGLAPRHLRAAIVRGRAAWLEPLLSAAGVPDLREYEE